jgi:hypothetical protein
MINLNRFDIDRVSAKGGERKAPKEVEKVVKLGRFRAFMEKYVIVENPKGSKPVWFSAKVAFWSTVGIGLLMIVWYLLK